MQHRTLTPTRRLTVTLVVLLAAAVLAPAVALAAGGSFTDDDTSIFEADIEWLAGAGVTKGCNPPDNTLFCPEDDVTRGQMAAFMRRFAAFLGAEDGVVSKADSAATAGDSDTVDGWDAADLLAVGPTLTLVSGDAASSTNSDEWEDVPGMSTSIVVPPGENRDAVITFSATTQCDQNPPVGVWCAVRVLVDDTEVWSDLLDSVEHSGGHSGYGTHSLQAFATDLVPGSHLVTVQYGVDEPNSLFTLQGKRLSVMTLPVSQVSAP